MLLLTLVLYSCRLYHQRWCCFKHQRIHWFLYESTPQLPTAWSVQVKDEEQEAAKFDAVFPCILRILPACVFNKKDPIIVGVDIEEGIAKVPLTLCPCHTAPPLLLYCEHTGAVSVAYPTTLTLTTGKRSVQVAASQPPPPLL